MFNLALICIVATFVRGNELDDYVSADDENYTWSQVERLKFKSLWGGTGYVLNVTSQKWLDKSLVRSPNGDLWTHQVVIIVPKHLKFKNVSHAYLTGSANPWPDDPPQKKVYPVKDYDVFQIDELAHKSNQVVITVKQLPNAPLIYKSDPKKRHRHEDAALAWSWKEYLEDPNSDPRWLLRLPMAKAAFQCMRAAQEFLK